MGKIKDFILSVIGIHPKHHDDFNGKDASRVLTSASARNLYDDVLSNCEKNVDNSGALSLSANPVTDRIFSDITQQKSEHGRVNMEYRSDVITGELIATSYADCDPRIRLAWEVIHVFGFGGSSPSKEVQDIIDKICGNRPVSDCYNEINDYAIDLCENIDDMRAYELLFNIYRRRPKDYFEKAIATGNKLIELNPNNSSTHYWLGIMYYKENYLPEAEKHLSTAWELNPQSDLACKWLAMTYMKMNNLDKGLEILYIYRDSKYYPQYPVKILGLDSIEKSAPTIDAAIRELEEKKARGYVFRPRKNTHRTAPLT